MVAPEDRERMRGAIKQAIDTHSQYEMEYRIYWPDGSLQWIVARGRALYDENEVPVRMAGVTLKVTESKRSEEILRASEEKSRNILESVSDAFFALDRTWRFTYVNRQAAVLLDREPTELLGKALWEEYSGLIGSPFENVYRLAGDQGIASSVTAFYPDHVAAVTEKFEHYVQTGQVWEDTFPLRGKDGSYRWC